MGGERRSPRGARSIASRIARDLNRFRRGRPRAPPAQLPQKPEDRGPPRAVPARQGPRERLRTIDLAEHERPGDHAVEHVPQSSADGPEGDRPDAVLASETRREDQDHEEEKQARPDQLRPSKQDESGRDRHDEQRDRYPLGYAEEQQRFGSVLVRQAAVQEDPIADLSPRSSVRAERRQEDDVRGDDRRPAAQSRPPPEERRMERRHVLDEKRQG